MTETYDIIGRVERLRDDPTSSVPSFQGVLLAALGLLESVRIAEEQASYAAISLAQRESVLALVAETEATVAALRSIASRPQDLPRPGQAHTAASWWYALAESTQIIESAIDRMSYVVSGQPKGSAVRGLVTEILKVLRGHHRLLIGEATRWIDG